MYWPTAVSLENIELINNSYQNYSVDISGVAMSTVESNFSLICLSTRTYKAVPQRNIYSVTELEIVNGNFG